MCEGEKHSGGGKKRKGEKRIEDKRGEEKGVVEMRGNSSHKV